MQYIVTAYDGENMLEKRMSVRPRHLENIKSVKEYGSIICAGGILDDEGNPAGSVLVMEFRSADLLKRYLDSEPYIAEHVWETVNVERMNVVIVNDEKVGK